MHVIARHMLRYAPAAVVVAGILATCSVPIAALPRVCYGNHIGLAQFQAKLVNIVVIPPHCTEINLNDQGVGSTFADAFAKALHTNIAVTSVNLNGNNIGDAGAASLAEAFKLNRVISAVRLSRSGIGPSGAASLAKAFETNSNITSVDLSDNTLGDAGAASLGQALMVNSAITSVDLSGNSIGGNQEYGALVLAEAFKVNAAVTSVNLGNNLITQEGATFLARSFAVNTAITSLNMSVNNIRSHGAFEFSHALKRNTVLSALDLSRNNLGWRGADYLARNAFAVNTAITWVDLSGNAIGDQGVKALATAFKANSTAVAWVDLSENEIKYAGVTYLVDMLKINKVITSVNLRGNSITSTGAAHLAMVLKTNTVITSVDLSGNHLWHDGATSLAEAFKVNSVITAVHLRDCSFMTTGALSLADAFKINTAIATVDLRGNKFNSEGAAALAEAFSVNTAIRTVLLGGNNIGSTGVRSFAALFAANTAITAVSLRDNNIWPAGIADLADAFMANTVLTSVDLSDNSFGDVGAGSLAVAFETNSAITKINLSGNRIGADGAAALAEAFTVNTGLTAVALDDNLMGAEWLSALTWLVDNAGIRSVVECSGAGIFSHVGGTCQCSGLTMLGTGPTCSDRTLVPCFSKDVALAPFQLGEVDTLTIAARCHTLNLSGSNIRDVDAHSLAAALKATTAVTAVILDDTGVEAGWAAAIAWLVDNAGIRSISECSGSGIIHEPSGACQCSGLLMLGRGPACANVVCVAKDIELGRLQSSSIRSLVIPPRCIELDLNNSFVSDTDALALADALVGNTVVAALFLGSNQIGDRGAAWLASTFMVNGVLTSVDLSGNLIGDLGADRLIQALEANEALVEIDLRNNEIGNDVLATLACHQPSLSGEPSCSSELVIKRKTNGTRTVAAVAATIAAVVAASVGFVCFIFYIRRRDSACSTTVATKFVAVARARAEARFVIEYRQLVSAKTLLGFQREIKQLEVPRATVMLGAELGRGQSGVVFRGAFADHSAHLAVKTRSDPGLNVGGAAAVADEALMLEAMLLNGLRHPGIVALLAVVTAGASVLVCTELMANGNLRDYLRGCRPGLFQNAASGNSSNTQPVAISPQLMVAMATKLSSAMSFLERHGIIHRDIAGRNVLVGKAATDVKLADLGAARNVHRMHESECSGVYMATTDHSPARWMPLEALREARFSHKSDVFAFGVLLWEVLTLGQTPWGVFGVPDFTEALAHGDRLKFPAALGHGSSRGDDGSARGDGGSARGDGGSACGDGGSANTIYDVALRCWKEDPVKRPHFHQLEAEFAVHHAVLAASNLAGRGSGTKRSDTDVAGRIASGETDLSVTALDPGGYVADTASASSCRLTALDTDGYVADTKLLPETALDPDGYVADTASASPCRLAALDTDGYVADTKLLPPTEGDAPLQPRGALAGGALAGGALADSLQGSSNSNRVGSCVQQGRSGIAPRDARKQSVYNGFDRRASFAEERPSGPQLSTNRRAVPNAVPNAVLVADAGSGGPLAGVNVGQKVRRPSLYLGFQQAASSNTELHNDETRL
jgi:Ran GTPase-activating protein (RanGAP) involved in mRNA processing and transport/serine/threonine protein kinase